ncbi:MAG: tryptophan synthase subunit alpha [Dokdonella sp.]
MAESRIDRRFAELGKAGRTGLIPFVTAGDPFPKSTVAIMHALVESGADLIELGMPFSDPMADGPTIQHASERALAKGVGLVDILGWVRDFRSTDNTTPIVLMGYLNPIEMFGYPAFAAKALEVGVDGVLIVDCPVEESATLEDLRAAGLQQIHLIAPTTADARLAAIREQAQGFLYYVSFAGITGANKLDSYAVRQRVELIKFGSHVPVAVGFGVRDAAMAAMIAQFADAVVIGSALVERLADSADGSDACNRAAGFLAPIRAALDACLASNAA